MKKKELTGILCLAALTGSALAVTQDTTPPAAPVAQHRAGTYDRSTSATSSAPRASGHAIRASQVIGSTVRASDGKTVGQVRDIVVDPQSGRIDFAILSLSSVSESSKSSSTSIPSATAPATPSSSTPSSSTTYSASTGMKLVPVPWPLFSHSLSGTSATPSSSTLGGGTLGGTMSLMLNVDEAKLRNAPSFDANNWSTLQGSDFGQRSYTYYGLDWNSRMSEAGTAGSGVSRGVGTSSSDPDRTSTQPNEQGEKSTLPDRNATSTTSPQPK